MFIMTLFKVVKLWSLMPRCPPAEESRQEMWYPKGRVKKNETVPFSREWVQLDIIMIKKRTHIQKGSYCVFSV